MTDSPLCSVLESSRMACESLLQQQQIDLEINCSEHLHARINASLLEQAIINLLTNAIKYSDVGGRVVIETVEQEKQIGIRVQDFGCGIEQEHHSRIFERFYRADQARSRNLGGTGLGLSIVKHVAQAHRGEVEITSISGRGAALLYSCQLSRNAFYLSNATPVDSSPSLFFARRELQTVPIESSRIAMLVNFKD